MMNRESFRQLQRDIEIVLNMRVGERGIAADQQNFRRSVLQRLIDLPAPPVAGLKRQDVGEHTVAFSLELGRPKAQIRRRSATP
jgi:hypothetical protein